MPDLADGDREPFQQMTFTLHDEQAEQVRAAIEKARAMGAFVNTGNENGNGNALARICEVFNGLG
jgi:acyl-CoA reductase-like NAD-dependent aldehyde dehydrogenase